MDRPAARGADHRPSPRPWASCSPPPATPRSSMPWSPASTRRPSAASRGRWRCDRRPRTGCPASPGRGMVPTPGGRRRWRERSVAAMPQPRPCSRSPPLARKLSARPGTVARCRRRSSDDLTVRSSRDLPRRPMLSAGPRALVDPALEAAVARLHPELRPPVEHHLAGGGKRRPGRPRRSVGRGERRPTRGGGSWGRWPSSSSTTSRSSTTTSSTATPSGVTVRRCGPSSASVRRSSPATRSLTLAMQVLLEEPAPGAAGAAVRLAAATQQMIAGQADDMAFETSSDVVPARSA